MTPVIALYLVLSQRICLIVPGTCHSLLMGGPGFVMKYLCVISIGMSYVRVLVIVTSSPLFGGAGNVSLLALNL